MSGYQTFLFGRGTRFHGVNPVDLAPRIYVDPENPVRYAVLSDYDPPPDLMEQFLKGGQKGDEAAKKIYNEALATRGSVSFRIGPLLREFRDAIREAEDKGLQAAQCLGLALSRMRERGEARQLEARLSQLVVHPFNARFIAHDEAAATSFNLLVDGHALREPLLVVRVDDPALAKVHAAMFRIIAARAERSARTDEELRKLIDSKGMEPVYRAFTGSRGVLLKDERLVFSEGDRLSSITGVRTPEYFIIDGQLRAVAMEERFIQGYEEGRFKADGDRVFVEVVDGADPLTVSLLTFAMNMGSREIADADYEAYGYIFGLGYAATMRRVAVEVKSMALERSVRFVESLTPRTQLPGSPQPAPHVFLSYESSDGDEEVDRKSPPPPPPSPYEGPYEVLPDEPYEGVSQPQLIRRQQPSPPRQQHAPAASMAVEQVSRPAAEPPGDLDVIKALIYTFLSEPSTRQAFMIPNAVAVTFSQQVRKDFELLREKLWQPDIRYTNLKKTVVASGVRVNATLYAPIAWDKFCRSCRHPVLLAPTRCFFCGEVIDAKNSPLPYHFSYYTVSD